MALKVIFTDIHGTICPESIDLSNSVFEKTRDIVKKVNNYLIEKNIKLVLITGGTILEAKEVIDLMHLKVDSCYVGQGALYTLDNVNWKINSKFPFDYRSIVKNLIDYLNSKHIKYTLASSSEFITIIKYKKLTKKLHEHLIKNFSNIFKIYLIDAAVHMYTYVTNTKYEAMLHYMNVYNIQERSVLFYGNSSNDIDAFKEGSHLKLVSKTSKHYPAIDKTYNNVTKNLPVGKKLYLEGLLDFITDL
jgi:hydroxymethylpyrimidine pyrophosphatase-like HAD family hydrolase